MQTEEELAREDEDLDYSGGDGVRKKKSEMTLFHHHLL